MREHVWGQRAEGEDFFVMRKDGFRQILVRVGKRKEKAVAGLAGRVCQPLH